MHFHSLIITRNIVYFYVCVLCCCSQDEYMSNFVIPPPHYDEFHFRRTYFPNFPNFPEFSEFQYESEKYLLKTVWIYISMLFKSDIDLWPLTWSFSQKRLSKRKVFNSLDVLGQLGKPKFVQWPPKSSSKARLVGKHYFKPWGNESV